MVEDFESLMEKLLSKGVNLLILFNEEGEILWWKGRPIKGRNLQDGAGFCTEAVRKALQLREEVIMKNVSLDGKSGGIISSTLKTVAVFPAGRFCLYMDSGERIPLSEKLIGYAEAIAEQAGERLGKLEWKSGYFIGESEYAKNIRKQIEIAAKSRDPVLIEGETGTGKNLVAELIHSQSGRKGRFVVVHCCNLPGELFDSELFGYRKGAFTGAHLDKKGLIEEASGGTVFLDEITEASLQLQVKLLRFVETGKFRRIGETEERKVDVRIIAATNRNIEKAIDKGLFRKDLYYRLSLLKITIPPLRQRRKDVELLLDYFSKFLKSKKLTEEARKYLVAYPWPGNVRELIHLLKRLSQEAEETEIGLEEVKKFFHSLHSSDEESRIWHIWEQIRKGATFWEVVKKPFLKRDLNRHQVREIIREGLYKAGGSYKRLCRLMNLREEDYHRFMRFLNEQRLKP